MTLNETFLILLIGLSIPLLGTTLGSACVFFSRKQMGRRLQRMLTGFAAGIMVAASVWSLLIPSMEEARQVAGFPDRLSFVPAVIGFLIGTAFLLLLDHVIPHLHQQTDIAEGPRSKLERTTKMVLAVTLHNIPEGMAVGVVLASWLAGSVGVTSGSALALAIGIAIQNFPEGAIISMPLRMAGKSRAKSFLGGFLSGAVEPIGAALTLAASWIIVPALPYLLGFAAGAMMYVVVEELIPEMSAGKHSDIGTISFAVGFVLMMALDTALG